MTSVAKTLAHFSHATHSSLLTPGDPHFGGATELQRCGCCKEGGGGAPEAEEEEEEESAVVPSQPSLSCPVSVL